MENIVFSVSDLLSLAENLKADGMEFVELSTLEAQEDDGEEIPACLWASGFKSSSPEIRTDYEEIEAVVDFD